MTLPLQRLLLALLLLAGAAQAAPLSCQVARVVDGDTLHLTCDGVDHRVRLLGFDTPEVFHPMCPAEKRAGDQATRVMQGLVAEGPVTAVRFAGHDRYGRDLADVAIAGKDVAGVMLGSGLARPYQGHKHPDWCGILGS